MVETARPQFGTAFRGYRPAEVHAYIESMLVRFRQEQQELAAKLDGLQGERESVLRDLEATRSALADRERSEKMIAEVLIEAQQRAQEILVQAEAQAEEARRKVAADVAASRAELNRIRVEITQFHRDFSKMVESYQGSAGPPDLQATLEKLRRVAD
ncbi:MAG: DivIVA domain-containing protein [bacterium]|nr:DivIVA domain-containing protein [bacterium]